MKKIQVLALVMVFMLCFSVVAMAAPAKEAKELPEKAKAAQEKTAVEKVSQAKAADPKPEQPVKEEKPASVVFNDAVVQQGQTVILTATTLKQGSSFVDGWNGAEQLTTEKVEVEGVAYYEATAEFDATNLAPGSYTVTYTITMRAGNSDVYFTSTIERTVRVVGSAVQVRDFTIADSYFVEQGNTHNNGPERDNHYKLIVTKLNVTYTNDITVLIELAPNELLEAGGFSLNEIGRRFDLTYGGVTKQFTMDGPVPQ